MNRRSTALGAALGLALFVSAGRANAQSLTLEPHAIQVGVGGGGGIVQVSAQPPFIWTVTSNAPWVTVGRIRPDAFSYAVSPNPGEAARSTSIVVTGALPLNLSQAGLSTPVGAQNLVLIPPCRVADTREASMAPGFGPPALAAGVARNFDIRGSSCVIPPDTKAFSLNITVVPKGPLGYLTIWPTGQNRPFVSTLNSVDGRVKANAALLLEGAGGISVMATDATELIIDINGVFVDTYTNPEALAFYPVQPCRTADTRSAIGPLGGPALEPGTVRSFPIQKANCGIPAWALGYSLNVTAVPSGPLGHITMWGTGRPQPLVSTLNAPTGAVVANAAIVPAGDNSEITVFSQGRTHLVLDINGYFAWPGEPGEQHYYPVPPCRLLDTRNAPGSLGGPALQAGAERTFPLALANCGIAVTAQAHSLNATVVPSGVLGYLTLWAAGLARPFVSTLNVTDDKIVSNAAIVPAGANGSVSCFVTDDTHLVFDTNGYFAPFSLVLPARTPQRLATTFLRTETER